MDKSAWSSSAKDAIKPTGQEAEHRSVMTLSALHTDRVNSFVNLSGMWCGCPMQEHRLLANPFTGDIIISLRFQSPGVLGWKVEENQDGYYSLCPRHLAAGSARKFTLRTLQRSTKMVESGSHGQFAPETIRALLFLVCRTLKQKSAYPP